VCVDEARVMRLVSARRRLGPAAMDSGPTGSELSRNEMSMLLLATAAFGLLLVVANTAIYFGGTTRFPGHILGASGTRCVLVLVRSSGLLIAFVFGISEGP